MQHKRFPSPARALVVHWLDCTQPVSTKITSHDVRDRLPCPVNSKAKQANADHMLRRQPTQSNDAIDSFMSGRSPAPRRRNVFGMLRQPARKLEPAEQYAPADAPPPLVPPATLTKAKSMSFSPFSPRKKGGKGDNGVKWQHTLSGAKLSGDKKSFTCDSQLDDGFYSAALGPVLPLSGISEFALTIVRSDDNNGTSMLLGVAEEDGRPLSFGVGRVWGLGPWNGRLFGFPDGIKRDRDSVAHEVRGDPLMRGDMRGMANDAIVRIRVDMDNLSLSFKVAAASDWVVAGDGGRPIKLPAEGVRPFARCGRKGDSVKLSAITHTKTSRVSMPDNDSSPEHSPQPVPRPPPPPAAATKSQLLPSQHEEAWRRREGELLTLVDSLRSELVVARKQLDRERELRVQAEQSATAAQERADYFLRMSPTQQPRARRAFGRWADG